MIKLKDNKILIASGNKGKVSEIEALLSPFNVEVISAIKYAIEEPEENGDSFLNNAMIKSSYYAKATGISALADDSGLCVEALNGDPGIYSARWAGENKDFSLATNKIKEKLGNSENLSAKFVCALSLYSVEEDKFYNFEGEVKGQLSFPPKGDKGFGYDPIFIADGMDKTFAEISPTLKHKLSHRAKAFEKLIESCFL